MKEKKRVYRPAKIVSGGQTGVDRGALDAAIALGIDHGGWCPSGRLSEDGTIPSRYDLTETDSADYPTRTKQNVLDSDATLILYEKKISGGTLLTKRICKAQAARYHLVRIDHSEPKLDQCIEQTRNWLSENKPNTLNVAGPRESNHPGIEQRSLQFLLQVFTNR